MSFSMYVKEELLDNYGEDRHCRIAELTALICFCSHFIENKDGHTELQFVTENKLVADKFSDIVSKDFSCDLTFGKLSNKTYYATISDSKLLLDLLYVTGILSEYSDILLVTENLNSSKKVSSKVVKSACCKRAFLRGAFLCVGSVNDPDKTSYHLEFSSIYSELIDGIMDLLQFFDLNPKKILRKGQYVAYMKESEQISDTLAVLGASLSKMEFENKRAYKHVSNDINRLANCEAANANKSIVASVKHIEDIMVIQNTIGLDNIPDSLRDVAEIRLSNPVASIKEIGELLNPPVGKSGVNHRLRKLSAIADSIKK